MCTRGCLARCGKTFSISYLAAFLQYPFYKLDVHGGITQTDVEQFMADAISQVRRPSRCK